MAWPIGGLEQISLDSLAPLFETDPVPSILLMGCGAKFANEPVGLRAGLREKGVVLEWMDTGAACRTFNVLLTDGRTVAAALLAVD